MSYSFKQIQPDEEDNPEDYKQSIQEFNDFLEMLSLEAESQSLESSKEYLEDLRDSIKDEVGTFTSGTFTVVFEDVERLKIYKLKGFEVDGIKVVDDGLQARISKKREGDY